MKIARKRRPSSRLVAVALFAALGYAASAGAEIASIQLAPFAPTWQDRVEITVTGTVVTSCGAHIVHLGPALVVHDPELGSVLDVEIAYDPCDVLAPPFEAEFTVSTLAFPLLPGEYIVRVRDPAFGEQATEPLAVYDVSPLELVLPENTASDEPAVVQVRGWAPCPDLFDGNRDGGVIELSFSGNCAVLPPGSSVFVLEESLGVLPPGQYDVVLYDFDRFVAGLPAVVKGSFRVWNAEECVPSDTVLCLQDGRFRVEVTWENFHGGTGVGHAIPLKDDSGLFWFFREENVELTVKVLNGCALSDRYWVFLASGSNVEYRVTVTDTRADVTRAYENELGNVPRLVADVNAFATCP